MNFELKKEKTFILPFDYEEWLMRLKRNIVKLYKALGGHN